MNETKSPYMQHSRHDDGRMNREEAITYLKVIWNRYKAEYEIERETLDAYHMAIEALSAEPSDDIEGDIDFHIDLKHNRMTVFNNITESPNDVIEVVRCKDCRHRVFTKDGESNPHDIVCDYHMSDGFDETDFCSYGERREP